MLTVQIHLHRELTAEKRTRRCPVSGSEDSETLLSHCFISVPRFYKLLVSIRQQTAL